MPEQKITASCEFSGHQLKDILVLNPVGWFGKAWLVEIGGSYTPLFLVVEADTVSDAIDELSDCKKYGNQIHASVDDLADYPEDERHYDGSGRVIDLEHVMVHGQERSDLPFPVRYHGDALPEGGIDPRKYGELVEG
jgi:hypothetical protein